VLVCEAPPVTGGEKALNRFETLTLAPIDRRLSDTTLLDASEIAWIDAYHARVAAVVGPELDSEAGVWLRDATQPLSPS
jgi:Xaa-Pro aminopeptidase